MIAAFLWVVAGIAVGFLTNAGFTRLGGAPEDAGRTVITGVVGAGLVGSSFARSFAPESALSPREALAALGGAAALILFSRLTRARVA